MTEQPITVDFDVTDSAGLVGLAEDADKRGANRRVATDALVEVLHSSGLHVCAMRFPHGEGEWRTEWICRVLPGTEDAESFHKDEEGEVIHAVRIWIDVSYAAWEKYVVRGRAG